MIYSDSHGKLELYDTLYENSLIGSENSTAWDPHQPPPESPRGFLSPPCALKYFGPAPPSFDPDTHVYRWYSIHYEMGKKRTRESGEVKEPAPMPESPSDSAMEDAKPNSDTNAAPQATPPPSDAPPIEASQAQRQAQEALKHATALPASSNTSNFRAALSQQNGSIQAAAGRPAVANIAAAPAPPPQGLQVSPMASDQLLYHALHHTNIVVGMISAYLSQDALIRDMLNSQRDPMALPIQHHTLTHAVLNARGDMISARRALDASEKIAEYRTVPCFKTWIRASDGLTALVDIVQIFYAQNSLPRAEDINAMKQTWESCMAMRSGTEEHTAWNLCWDMLIKKT